MRRSMVVPLTLAAAYLFVAALALGKSTKKIAVDGSWKGKWGNEAVTLKLSAKGQELRGTLAREIEIREDLRNTPDQKTSVVTVDIEEGKIDGEKIEFKCKMVGPEGQELEMSFKGLLKQDRLELTPSSGKAFTLTRSSV